MTSNRKEVIRMLPSLSPTDLMDISKNIEFLLRSKTNKGLCLEPDELLLYSSAIEILRQRHLKAIPVQEGNSTYPRLRGFDLKKFREGYNEILRFMKTHKIYVSGPKRIRFFRVISNCIMEYGRVNAEQWNKRSEYRRVPIGIKLYLENMINIEEAFDYCFPDYISSGLVNIIIEYGGSYVD